MAEEGKNQSSGKGSLYRKDDQHPDEAPRYVGLAEIGGVKVDLAAEVHESDKAGKFFSVSVFEEIEQPAGSTFTNRAVGPKIGSGKLFRNTKTRDGKPVSDGAPHFRGDVTCRGQSHWMSAWVRLNKDGTKYFSLAFQAKEASLAETMPRDAVIDEMLGDGAPAPVAYADHQAPLANGAAGGGRGQRIAAGATPADVIGDDAIPFSPEVR